MRRSSNAVRRQPIELINCIEKAKDARNVLSLENAGTRDSIHTVRVKMQLALRCFLRSRPVFLVGTTYRSKTHLDFRVKILDATCITFLPLRGQPNSPVQYTTNSLGTHLPTTRRKIFPRASFLFSSSVFRARVF